jgi:hypothetical protein
MTDDLSTLPEPVREAVENTDKRLCKLLGPGEYREWNTIRAELLRLYSENAQLRDVCAESELNREGIKHAHAELKALRARIANAPIGFWTAAMPAYVCLPSDWMSIVTKWHDLDRVRLLVDDGDA